MSGATAGSTPDEHAPTRQRNARGDGAKLRAELLAAARSILEAAGDEDAVARAAGVTAPSIYRHFAGRDEIVDALVSETFDEFIGRLRAANGAASSPDDALQRLCAAYVTFATERPGAYLVLFQRRPGAEGPGTESGRARAFLGRGGEAFGILVEAIRACADAGLVRSGGPASDAELLWAGMHGGVVLRASSPGFPWRETLPDATGKLLLRLLDLPLP